MTPCFHISLWASNYVADPTHPIFSTFYFNCFIILSVWVFCLHIGLYTTCVPDACRGQKMVFYPLEMELQTSVRPGTGARIWTHILWKTNQYSINCPVPIPNINLWVICAYKNLLFNYLYLSQYTETL